MIICSGCRHSEIEGAIFCSNCGASLIGQDSGISSQNIAVEQKVLVVELLDLKKTVKLFGKEKYVLGRSVPSQPMLNIDLDFGRYNGYEYGVSRKHAMLKIQEGTLQVVDLNSSNRTFVDGEEIYPGIEHDIDENSVIRLGKLRIRILLKDE